MILSISFDVVDLKVLFLSLLMMQMSADLRQSTKKIVSKAVIFVA
jgi:hypothetical protein